ncbi:phage major capsid E family protein [Yersinia rochesterensis]|uniref:Phage major capsid E family protein n=2 Tax=Yersinia rochesterensis TaxID=1604335 RepID=A0ABN4FGI5_9GAMM|nr:major capsid protein [Yersinia rochesterensis]AIN18160.1 phage major capsid E family protein [Yersinia rochesterensis]AJI85886.1 phage major capsid E family protein [Yersinia frederiksenii Y225]AJJ36331.1 phage major capsid E family protein [Yersinia rochesterensis]CRY63676.1 Uncharacterised protein [Yersinia kristensenii]
MTILSANNNPNQLVDLTESFKLIPSQNYLLQNLGLFNFKPSATRSIAVDYLVSDNAIINTETMRYGTDQNTTILDRYSSYNISIPHFYRQDVVTPEAFQSRRAMGTDSERTVTSVIIDYLDKHHTAYRRTTEQLLAKCLFKNTVDATKTENPNINWVDTFGFSQQVATVDLASASTDVPMWLDDVMVKLRNVQGNLSTAMQDTIVFCGSNFYSKLRFHASVKELFTFTSAADNSNNIITTYKEAANLPGFSMFRFMDMTFIRVEDASYGIDTNEAYFVPKFSPNTTPYVGYFGPASRNMDVAQMSPQRVYSYRTYTDMQMVNVHNEHSLLPASLLPNVVLKATNTAS